MRALIQRERLLADLAAATQTSSNLQQSIENIILSPLIQGEARELAVTISDKLSSLDLDIKSFRLIISNKKPDS